MGSYAIRYLSTSDILRRALNLSGLLFFSSLLLSRHAPASCAKVMALSRLPSLPSPAARATCLLGWRCVAGSQKMRLPVSALRRVERLYCRQLTQPHLQCERFAEMAVRLGQVGGLSRNVWNTGVSASTSTGRRSVTSLAARTITLHLNAAGKLSARENHADIR